MRVLALLALLPLAVAQPGVDECSFDGNPAAGVVQVSGGDDDSTFYVDHRGSGGLWIYQESNGNGIDLGYDYGGSNGHYSDPCVRDPRIVPDTLVF